MQRTHSRVAWTSWEWLVGKKALSHSFPNKSPQYQQRDRKISQKRNAKPAWPTVPPASIWSQLDRTGHSMAPMSPMWLHVGFPHRSSCLQGFEERQATACNLRSVTLVTKRDIPVCFHELQLSNSTDPPTRFHAYRLVLRIAGLRCKLTVPSPPHQLRTADGGCDSSRWFRRNTWIRENIQI
jgi:hypothetical protein